MALEGDCSACHTMHNSYEGQAVAKKSDYAGGVYTGTSSTVTPLANLLKYDCIGCHATNPAGTMKKIVDYGGNEVPQVMHADPTGDLAGGNFRYINTGGAGNHSGHNVKELFAGDPNYAQGNAPGQYRGDSTHSVVYTDVTNFDTFSCAGAGGCHGTRSQLLSGSTNDNGTAGDTTDDTFENAVKRTGMAAIAGSHHKITDGVKDATNVAVPTQHDADYVAAGYRLIPGLKGFGNDVDGDRWENVDENSHNEYYGKPGAKVGQSCGDCHVEGNDGANGGLGSRMTWDSILVVPNNSQSGFCTTCHGLFHTVGDGSDGNGTSGAFLRHPSDYVLPTGGEFEDMTTYNVNTKVARQDITGGQSASVTAGSDMVMCLSCHGSHATPYRHMLTFDYDAQVAGNGDPGDGCLACHTSKQ
ncbi:cytochrome c3 family protein [Desulfuromonas sp. TF]|uniref:cytochrome c3 family protein n=1 Tax=Desulfuromonas sp. TF TaxID=1232410 RepID=UPI00138AD337|nr:cytochrome c3 family protein [Desulfuromonas sp. TF]